MKFLVDIDIFSVFAFDFHFNLNYSWTYYSERKLSGFL